MLNNNQIKTPLIILFFSFSSLISQIKGNYGQEYEDNYGYEVKFGQGRRIVDDYICDLDASVLVVTSSDNAYKKASTYAEGSTDNYEYAKQSYPAGYEEAKRTKRSEAEYAGQQYKNYGEYGNSFNKYKVAKAHRLRCSIIASGSDDDCRKCCHMAARKERSIAKDSIFGFVVDYDEVNLSQYTAEASSYLHTPYRSKRDAVPATAYTPAPTDYKKEEEYKQPAASYASPSAYSPATNYQNYYNYEKTPNNPRCVCCSPRVYSVQKTNYDNNYGKKISYGPEKYNKYEQKEYSGEAKKKYENKGEYGKEEYGAKKEYEAPKRGYEAPQGEYEPKQGGYEEGYGENSYGPEKYNKYEGPKPKDYNYEQPAKPYNNYEQPPPKRYHQYGEKREYYRQKPKYSRENYGENYENYHHGRGYNEK